VKGARMAVIRSDYWEEGFGCLVGCSMGQERRWRRGG
jgi:hypothetical protein